MQAAATHVRSAIVENGAQVLEKRGESDVLAPATGQLHHVSLHSPTNHLLPNSRDQLSPAARRRGRFLPLGAFPFLGRKGDDAGDAQTDAVPGPRSVRVDLDLYALVGVSKEAEKTEIDARLLQAEKELSDLGADPSVLKMLRAAHEVLTDDDMRAAYDSTGLLPAHVARALLVTSSSDGEPREGRPEEPPEQLSPRDDGHASQSGEDEEQRGGEVGVRSHPGLLNVFSSLFGSSARRRGTGSHRAQGNDVWATVTLRLSEIGCSDAEKQVTVEALEDCVTCDGTGGKDGQKAVSCAACDGKGAIVKTKSTNMGMLRTSQTCPTCRGSGEQARLRCSNCAGSGRVKTEKTLQVVIPAGVSDGMRLRIKGQGDVGVNGGPSGDLLLKVEVENDTPFRREGNNLLGIVRISYVDAILGLDDKEIDVLDGVAHIAIPPGTQSGEKIVVKGRGTRDPDMAVPPVPGAVPKTARGDHIAVIEVELPKNVSPEERALLERLRRLRSQ
ncbi:hypothetical protein NCLIV_008040 [Neospora caninum Liverpool]|uniref:Uncharacterized protein n=1 Tax=Neospora caninum (strain Liverpool) TaxID=572307 RepID=F0V9A6_NEOCL|nr:hypothetical protein NCLIV_008040 [Neospora caninum Liverpool]CBZ50331.1 hypothetical protein NCLIV_008040 [Neospora caninum Liverpool]|eukprot:XP_003880365.1 hypothetical protein NCLIV_008040 [Neospora caninum Liverpool]